MKRDKKLDDINYFKRIKNMFDNKQYDFALQEIRRFIELYPESEYGIHLYALALVRCGHIEDGIEQYKKLFGTSNENLALLDLSIIYIEQEKFDIAYEYCLKLEKIETNKKYKEQIFLYKIFCENKLGIKHSDNDKDKLMYTGRQIDSYDINEALYHVEKHSYELKDNFKERERHSYFLKDFDIKELFYKTRDRIDLSERLYPADNIDDNYVFRCKDIIGFTDDKPTRCFKVVTLHKSNDIIAMYPILEDGIINVLDFEKEEDILNTYSSGKKIKRLSAIEKFNKRYNLNN